MNKPEFPFATGGLVPTPKIFPKIKEPAESLVPRHLQSAITKEAILNDQIGKPIEVYQEPKQMIRDLPRGVFFVCAGQSDHAMFTQIAFREGRGDIKVRTFDWFTVANIQDLAIGAHIEFDKNILFVSTEQTDAYALALVRGLVKYSERETTEPIAAGTVEHSGGKVNYYRVHVTKPNQADDEYIAECGDIIEALGMDFNEGCAFKALWRSAAARTLGKKKKAQDALYDAEKVVFYGQRILAMLSPPANPKMMIVGELAPTSVKMDEARMGGLTDSRCGYLAFPNNVCNKCGHAHNGLQFVSCK